MKKALVKKILCGAAGALGLALCGVFFLDNYCFQKALPWAEKAADDGHPLGGILCLLKVFGVADSLVIFVMAAGALGYRRAACRVLLAFCVVGATVLPLKHIVGRERPDKSECVSFPSGDTATVSVLPTALLASTPVTAVSAGLAGGVAFSRIMYKRHYFSDVVGGMAIGLFAGLAGGWLLTLGLRLVHWLPPREWFLLGFIGVLLSGVYFAWHDGHHRHMVQLVAWFGPALALFFLDNYCRHHYRRLTPPGGEKTSRAWWLDLLRVTAIAALAGIWAVADAPALPYGWRLPVFAAALAVLIFTTFYARLRQRRRGAAARNLAVYSAIMFGIYGAWLGFCWR